MKMRKTLLTCMMLLVFFGLKAQTVVFSENFNNGWPAGFLRVNNDGKPTTSTYTSLIGMNAWTTVRLTSGDTLATSCSALNPAGQADRWMITPPITIPSANTLVRWRAKAQSSTNPDGYIMYARVVTSATDTNMAGFTDTLFRIPAENSTNFVNRFTNLAAYSGQTIRIAVRNNSTNKALLFFDDLQVVDMPSVGANISNLILPTYIDSMSPATTVKCQVSNSGLTAITSLTVAYQVNQNTPITQTFSGLGISSFGNSTLSYSQIWTPTVSGTYRVKG